MKLMQKSTRCENCGVFPENSHPPIIYPVAITKDAKLEAAKYLAFLTKPEATAVSNDTAFACWQSPPSFPFQLRMANSLSMRTSTVKGHFHVVRHGQRGGDHARIATAFGLSVEGAGPSGEAETAVSPSPSLICRVRLGGAELSDIALPVIPLPQFITDRGNHPPLAGLIGFGVLSRFAVRLSYDDQTLTLIPAGIFGTAEEGNVYRSSSPTKPR